MGSISQKVRMCAVALLLPAWAAQAQDASQYPNKPIRLIAASSPGSGPDVLGRLLAGRISEAWGQQVIVDTRPGASGIIGTEIAAKSSPDGYTLIMVTAQATIVSVMYDNLKYDLTRDFAPVSLLGSTPFILALNPSVAATSVKELIALARAKPGELRYGSGGSGSPPHLSAEMLKSMTRINIEHVPYKGVTPAITDSIAGHVQMVIAVIPAVLPSVRAGRLRALAVTSPQRSEIVPDLPTIAETVPDYEFVGWYSIFAPAKTPAAIINKLNGELVKAVKLPETRARLSDIGVEASGTSPQVLAAYLADQQKRMRAAVMASGARPDR